MSLYDFIAEHSIYLFTSEKTKSFFIDDEEFFSFAKTPFNSTHKIIYRLSNSYISKRRKIPEVITFKGLEYTVNTKGDYLQLVLI